MRLRWSQISDEGLSIRQSKTRTELLVPPTEALVAYLAQIEGRGATIVTAVDGGPLGYSGFAKRFRAALGGGAQLREAGEADMAELMARLTVHGWRYTVASETLNVETQWETGPAPSLRKPAEVKER